MAMIAKNIAVTIVMTMLGHAAWSASFDCRKAHSRVEDLICATDSLSTLDSRLGRAYAMALHDAYPAQRPTLISNQKEWLQNVRDRCGDIPCLTTSYQSRVHALSSLKTQKTAAEYVTDDKEWQAQTANFESSLHAEGIPGSLSCALLVRLVVDGNDASYGAVCSLGARRLMLCNDTLVGKLTVDFGSIIERGEALADFAANNCPPGG
jgi:uncharacterized protein